MPITPMPAVVDRNGHRAPHRQAARPRSLSRLPWGGGGNFGILTSFRFDKLPTAPRQSAEAGLSFPWADMTEAKFTKLLITYGEYFESRGRDPDTWGLFAGFNIGPKAAGKRNDAGWGGRHISVSAQFCNPDGGVSDLAPFHEFFAHFKEFEPVITLPTKLNSANSPPPSTSTTPRPIAPGTPTTSTSCPGSTPPSPAEAPAAAPAPNTSPPT